MTTIGWFPADVVLDDGGRVHIRPLGRADAALVARGFEQLSAASRRLRFFSTIPRLSPALLRWLVDVDQHDHLALLAVRADEPGSGLGIARAVRSHDDPEHAEVAVTVLDKHHGRGIGSALLKALRRAALAEGITHFDGHVLVDNAAALGLLRHADAELHLDEPGVYAFSLPLRPVTATRRATVAS